MVLTEGTKCLLVAVTKAKPRPLLIILHVYAHCKLYSVVVR